MNKIKEIKIEKGIKVTVYEARKIRKVNRRINNRARNNKYLGNIIRKVLMSTKQS